MQAEGREAAREEAASEAAAEASTRAAAREAPGSAAGEYVPCQVPSLHQRPSGREPLLHVRVGRHHRPVFRIGVPSSHGNRLGRPAQIARAHRLRARPARRQSSRGAGTSGKPPAPPSQGAPARDRCQSLLIKAHRKSTLHVIRNIAGRPLPIAIRRDMSGHCLPSSPCCEHAPHRGPIRSAARPTHSEHLSGAKRHVR